MGPTKKEIRRLIEEVQKIKNGDGDARELSQKHEMWQREAGKAIKQKIIDRKATVKYACDNPQLSGREIVKRTRTTASRYAVDMARLRRFRAENEVVNVADLIRTRKHHLLANDDENILVFGRPSAVQIMSETNFIFADGTFKCVLDGYSQLYVFHAMVENNVSLPMLFCLVKGKKLPFTKSCWSLLKVLRRSPIPPSSTDP